MVIKIKILLTKNVTGQTEMETVSLSKNKDSQERETSVRTVEKVGDQYTNDS